MQCSLYELSWSVLLTLQLTVTHMISNRFHVNFFNFVSPNLFCRNKCPAPAKVEKCHGPNIYVLIMNNNSNELSEEIKDEHVGAVVLMQRPSVCLSAADLNRGCSGGDRLPMIQDS
jgi:hypothetical protein